MSGIVSLRYAEEATEGTYKRPSVDDRSTEPISSIVRLLPEPQLEQELSKNRNQFFEVW